MEKLNLPEFNFNLRKKGNSIEIFDSLRKKHIALTPEEWVRQHILAYLVEYKNIPEGFIQIEGSIQVAGLKKRFDILVYSKTHTPALLIECKEPRVRISQNTFDQVCRYNSALQVPFLLVTNGLQHFCFSMNAQKQEYIFLDHIPNWDEINAEP